MKTSDFPKVRFELITPAVAQELLDATPPGTNFRKLSENEARKYARFMAAGTFRSLNGQTISIDNDGAIVDGQHRLRAIVISGQSLWMLVVRGVETSDAATIDVGYIRRLVQVLQGEGVKHYNVAAALAYWSQWYLTGSRPDRRTDLQQQLNFVHKTPFVAEACGLGAYVDHVIPGAHGALLYLLAKNAGCEGQAREFLTSIATGANLGLNSPAFRLRKKMLGFEHTKGAKKTMDARGKLALLIKCWNLHRLGLPCLRLHWQDGEAFPAFEFGPSCEASETAPKSVKA